MPRVVLAMSGGVDSSVAAHLLLSQGYDVVGVFMRHGERAIEACAMDGRKEASPLLPLYEARSDHKQGCCSATDAEDARRVADRLGIPFYALNLEAEFRRIVDYFIDEYSAGRTPNPCVMCNNWIKFGKLFDYADSIGAEFVATGHYARIVAEAGGNCLARGLDRAKDQSYVLFGIEPALLSRMRLPVGDFEKPRIRELAAGLGLRVADKKDSQEICFVTSGKHDEFVRARRGTRDTAGNIVTTDGRVVGTHPGIEGFTIGQRKGLAVAMGERWYVVRIEPDTRHVVIGRRDELARRELTARQCNWQQPVPSGAFRCLAQIRYNAPAAAATGERLAGDRLRLVFDEPRHGVAPGQAVVCYAGDQVLGGGWIA
ncbi:MAG: tRNA 2-thiouridine(34) synthase MnmA [Pirellulaceae bacterium]